MRVVHIHINLLRASQAILGYDIFGEWMYVTADGDVTRSALKAYKIRTSLESKQCQPASPTYSFPTPLYTRSKCIRFIS